MDDPRVRPGVLPTAYLLTALGVLVCSILVVMEPMQLWTYRQLNPESWRSSLVGYVSVTVLALLVLVVCFRAWRRTMREGREAARLEMAPFLARAVPWLALVGAALGVFLGIVIARGERESTRSYAQLICAEAIGSDVTAGMSDACITAAATCIDHQAAIERRTGVAPFYLDPRTSPRDTCIREKLHLPPIP